MDWLLLLHLVTIAAISFRHAGIVAPVTASLPVLVGVTCLYAREHMRLPVLTFTAAVIIFCMLTAMGVIAMVVRARPQSGSRSA